MSKNTISIIFIICFSFGLQAQPKFILDRGKISFTSNAPLEIIKATSSQVKGILDPSTNQFLFSVEVSSFMGFNSDLQRIHFNEKYMESEKFNTASFKGKIIEQLDFSKDGTYEVRAKGDFEIHGQKQVRIIKSNLNIKNGVISIECNFNVPLDDHNISVPKIINEKIATEIQIAMNATMSQNKLTGAYIRRQ